MALGSRRGSVVCRGQLRRGASVVLRVAIEAKELMEGRIVLVAGAGLFGAPEWRADARGAEARVVAAAAAAETFVGEVAGAVVAAVVGAG